MTVPRLVICAPSINAVHVALRELDIPPHPFLRRDIVIVSEQRDTERARGLSAHWTILPGHRVSETIQSILAASARGAGQLDWHEAIARVLAWRQYHEC